MPIGTTELLLIVFVVIVLFGAKRIPELARALGRASAEYKKAKRAIEEEGKELVAETEREEKAEKPASSPSGPADKA